MQLSHFRAAYCEHGSARRASIPSTGALLWSAKGVSGAIEAKRVRYQRAMA